MSDRPQPASTSDASLEDDQSCYARSALGRLDARLLGNVHARRLLMVVAGLALIVPSVQFVLKIQQTEYSEFRGALKHRTAIGRWLPDAQALQDGEDPYSEGHWFPNPPLVLLALVPFANLPIVVTAVVWSILKIAAVVAGCLLIVRASGRERWNTPLGVLVMAAVFSARPVIGDITHGNINIFVFLQIALGWYLFVRGRDFWSGVVLGLAAATKVTPALLLVYFVYKRAWRVGAGAAVGLIVFVVLIPALLLGFDRNNSLLASWHHQMVAPYVADGFVTVEEVNQSLPGMFMKWAAFPHYVRGTWIDVWNDSVVDGASVEPEKLEALIKLRDKLQASEPAVRLADTIAGAFPTEVGSAALAKRTGQPLMARLSRPNQRWILRAANLLIIAVLAWLCRAPTSDRRDPRLLLELSLVLLAMLLLSERTWKHHLVTLPIIYLATWRVLACYAWSARFRGVFVAGLILQFVFLVLLKSDILMYVGVITMGLLLCLLQNAVLLRRLTTMTVSRQPEAPAVRPSAGRDKSA